MCQRVEAMTLVSSWMSKPQQPLLIVVLLSSDAVVWCLEII
jgi:hypothetical protein